MDAAQTGSCDSECVRRIVTQAFWLLCRTGILPAPPQTGGLKAHTTEQAKRLCYGLDELIH
jgi:hypothetical protein